jgi:hypothetical protein
VRRVSLIVSIALAASARPVAADDALVAEARRHEASLEYEEALALVERALAAGTSGPDRVVELHLFAGRMAAGLDRGPAATAHYARALALRPAIRLPDGTSPKLSVPFEAASLETVPLAFAPTLARDGTARLGVQTDPLRLVRGVAIAVAGRALVARDATTLVVPAGTEVAAIAALDEHGNRIWEGEVIAPALVPSQPVPVPPPVPRRPALIAWWPAWTLATGAALGIGGFAAWRVDVAQRQFDRLRAEPGQHDFSELVAVEDRGRRWGLTANLATGVATVTAVVAVITYVAQRRRSRSTIAVTPGGVAGVF